MLWVRVQPLNLSSKGTLIFLRHPRLKTQIGTPNMDAKSSNICMHRPISLRHAETMTQMGCGRTSLKQMWAWGLIKTTNMNCECHHGQLQPVAMEARNKSLFVPASSKVNRWPAKRHMPERPANPGHMPSHCEQPCSVSNFDGLWYVNAFLRKTSTSHSFKTLGVVNSKFKDSDLPGVSALDANRLKVKKPIIFLQNLRSIGKYLGMSASKYATPLQRSPRRCKCRVKIPSFFSSVRMQDGVSTGRFLPKAFRTR